MAPMQALLHLVAAPLQQIVDGIDPAHRADIRRLDDQHTPFDGINFIHSHKIGPVNPKK